MFESALYQAFAQAEALYDQVIRRWGNVSFAQSCLYEWVWSSEFCQTYSHLDERERGQLRISVLERFHVKAWPWQASRPSFGER